jgi:hypothetical protein
VREHRQEATPIAFLVEDGTHPVPVLAVAIQMPMLKLDAGYGFPLGDEANLDLCLEACVISLIGTYIPGEHEVRGRLPNKNAAPVAGTAILAAFVPAPANTRFDHGVNRVRGANLVGA